MYMSYLSLFKLFNIHNFLFDRFDIGLASFDLHVKMNDSIEQIDCLEIIFPTGYKLLHFVLSTLYEFDFKPFILFFRQ